MGKTHSLKTWPQHFEAVKDGRCTYQARNNDRSFAEGDTVELHEFDPVTREYTGADPLTFEVGYMYPMAGAMYGHENFVVFSLLPIEGGAA